MAATQRKLVSQLHSQVCCLLDGSANRRMPHFSLHRNYKQQINRNQQHVAANGSGKQLPAIMMHVSARHLYPARVCVCCSCLFSTLFLPTASCNCRFSSMRYCLHVADSQFATCLWTCLVPPQSAAYLKPTNRSRWIVNHFYHADRVAIQHRGQ